MSTNPKVKELLAGIEQQRVERNRKLFRTSKAPDPFGVPNEDKYDEATRGSREDKLGTVPLYGEGQEDAALQEFVANPPRDVLAEVADVTQNPELVQGVREDKEELACRIFLANHPEFVKDENENGQTNFHIMLEWMLANLLGPGFTTDVDDANVDEVIHRLYDHGRFSAGDLEDAYAACLRVGTMQVPKGTARNLRQNELMFVARMAASNFSDGMAVALCYYMVFASDYDDYDAILDMPIDQVKAIGMPLVMDAKWRPVADEGTLYCFKHGCHQYQSTPERDAFLLRYANGRPLNFNLLRAAFEALKKAEAQGAEQQRQNQVDFAEIEELSDSQVSDLYLKTQRARARGIAEANRQGRQFSNPEEAMAADRDEFNRR